MSADRYDDLLAEAARAGLGRLEARSLLEHASARARAWLIAHGDEPAGSTVATTMRDLVARRVAGEPIAYLTGVREFMGRRFLVDRRVLIPRADTELLAQLALGRAPAHARAIDLGTGSGVLALTLALDRADRVLVAVDASTDALAVARENGRRLGAAAIDWRRGDWWDACRPDERFDLAVANPPYVAASDPHLRAGDLRFEPPNALVGGADGLDAIRRLVAGAPTRLAAGAWLLVEHGWDQGPAVRRLLAEAGLCEPQTWRDDAAHERVSGAHAPTGAADPPAPSPVSD